VAKIDNLIIIIPYVVYL